MSSPHDPNHWYTHNCEMCYAKTQINFIEEEKPKPVYCPICGTATESEEIAELNFNY